MQPFGEFRANGWPALLLLLTALCLASPARAQTFPALTGRVVDAAHLLTPAQTAELEQLSAQTEAASSRQLVVATVPSLEGREIEDYGYRLGRQWAVGQKGIDNGAILLVAPNERKVRIEVGYGLEPILTDALSNVIVTQAMLPRFKAGDMGGGVVAGAQAIAEQLKAPPEAAEAKVAAAVRANQQQRQRRSSSGGGFVTAIFWTVILLFFVLPMLFGRRGRGQRYSAGGSNLPIVLWTVANALGESSRGGGGSSWGGGSGWGGGDSGGGGGGFSGGGGSFGGGGASGSW